VRTADSAFYALYGSLLFILTFEEYILYCIELYFFIQQWCA
jgi:hypothetical protein